MIVCTIDGSMVYPDFSSNVKVTYSNPYVTDSGTYTYDISFPMSIDANKMFFGHIDRFDVHKKMTTYNDFKLWADNKLIASGKGIITDITEEMVKIQLSGGKSRIKYDSKFENDYIDKLDVYGKVDTSIFMDSESSPSLTKNIDHVIHSFKSGENMVGVWGKYSFNTIYDETNGGFSNAPLILNGSVGYGYFLYDLAVQPWLMFVLKCVLNFEGFTIEENDYDTYPWNQLVIANASKTLNIKDALPHWTVYEFIENVRKLFNASFIFDDVSKTVKIVCQSGLLNQVNVNYEATDDFTMEYEEDGLSTMETSNIEYDFPDSENRSWREVISEDIKKYFTTKEYDDVTAMNQAAEAMTKKERQQTIFLCHGSYYVYGYEEDDTDSISERCYRAGYFNPIIRDSNSDDYQKLVIVPVAMTRMNIVDKDNLTKLQNVFNVLNLLYTGDAKIVVPSMTNSKEVSLDDKEADSDGEYFISVQDALEGSDTSSDDKTDEKMQIMFQSSAVMDYTNNFKLQSESEDNTKNLMLPLCFTDYRYLQDIMNFKDTSGVDDGVSLSLENLEHSLGNYLKSYDVAKNSEMNIKFLSNGIPDPKNIFIFKNKKYISSKIEVTINNNGIDSLKTGYFYEIN